MVSFQLFKFSILGPLLLFLFQNIEGQVTDENTKEFVNMSRYESLIEPDTCSKIGLNWNRIDAIWFKSKSLGMLYDNRHSNISARQCRIEFSFKSTNNYRKKPVYAINANTGTENFRYWSEQHRQLVTGYMDRYPILYYYPLDWMTLLLIFQVNQTEVLFGPTQDLYLIYNHVLYGDSPLQEIKILSEGYNDRGSIPLFHRKETDSKYLKNIVNLKLATTIINNVDYSYRSGHLSIVPLKLSYDHSYYYGFNHNMSKIYFASSQQFLIDLVPDHMPASRVVSLHGWHPFLCGDHVYLYVDPWIYYFPHLNLTAVLPMFDNPDVMEAPLQVMHRNTFFRCNYRTRPYQIRPRYAQSGGIAVLFQRAPLSSKSLTSNLIYVLLAIASVAALIVLTIELIQFKPARHLLFLKKNNSTHKKSSSSSSTTDCKLPISCETPTPTLSPIATIAKEQQKQQTLATFTDDDSTFSSTISFKTDQPKFVTQAFLETQPVMNNNNSSIS